MKSNRRNFISSLSLGGAALTLSLFSSCSSSSSKEKQYPDYTALDEAMKQPVLKKELFSEPVIIETLELLRDRNNYICRVRSKDGAEGLSIGHGYLATIGPTMFIKCLHHFFIGKDARDLDNLMHKAISRNLRRQGNPLNIHAATIEFAILDMLGNIANKPVGALIGEIQHSEIPIYLGTRLSELRNQPPEVSLELVEKDYLETKAKAIKIRAGIGYNTGMNEDNAPGRTEKLIRMAREKFGNEMVLMIDGNGTYDVDEAIRIGKILQEYNYYFWEEPVPWDWYEEQKRVAEGLKIKMAGGEQEFGLHAFRWLIANDVFDVVQPDLFYFGGMIRTMQVARMAEAAGKTITPHMSSKGLGYLYMLHSVSATPNADRFHEFKMFQTKDANGTVIPIESKTEPFSSINGVVKVPTGSGLGINIDPDYINKHKILDL
jgi:L-alanine-DL-glutamate epimerase-like enolase superfamily enzyme